MLYLFAIVLAASCTTSHPVSDHTVHADEYETRTLQGWTVHINRRLLTEQPQATQKALQLTDKQLTLIARMVAKEPLEKLQTVPLWFNPQYEGERPRAEYHPGRRWLQNNGRNPDMERCIEFSNVSIFERETKRMPLFVLHELAHAYHHQVLGHSHPGILATYQKAEESGTYEEVQRWRGPNIPLTVERAYGMNNEKEYFAEITEAYFGRNDFYPFIRSELKRHDPEGERLLLAIWGEPRHAWKDDQ